jgi:hypothetical protein
MPSVSSTPWRQQRKKRVALYLFVVYGIAAMIWRAHRVWTTWQNRSAATVEREFALEDLATYALAVWFFVRLVQYDRYRIRLDTIADGATGGAPASVDWRHSMTRTFVLLFGVGWVGIGLLQIFALFVFGTADFWVGGLMLIAMGSPLIWYDGWQLRRDRQRHGCCLHCGYDLRASVNRCPECGSPIPHQSNNPASKVPV